MPEPDILYHYCSNSAFHSIIETKTIWLSSLSLGNDSMEGKLVSELIIEMAEEDKLAPEDIERIKESVSHFESFIGGLGFCLSEENDLLSQWRGYAGDASGVSIGFSKSYLNELSKLSKPSETHHDSEKPGFKLEQVEYEKEAQKNLIKPNYNKIKAYLKKGAYKFVVKTGFLESKIDKEKAKAFQNLNMHIFMLFPHFFLLKTKAFKEEHEWRLISIYLSRNDKCLFRTSTDKIIPYREFELKKLVKFPNRIVKVYLGPKNKTSIDVVKSFLEQNGFNEIDVVRSSASYR